MLPICEVIEDQISEPATCLWCTGCVYANLPVQNADVRIAIERLMFYCLDKATGTPVFASPFPRSFCWVTAKRYTRESHAEEDPLSACNRSSVLVNILTMS